MTIHEIETRSGLDRANIRFYEREGLITPARLSNGYRNYTESDLRMLMKIKLLRRLGFSLDTIRSLQTGENDLDFALMQRLGAIAGERQSLAAAERVCREMRDDRATFSNLDAERYLSSYERALGAPSTLVRPIAPAVPESDRIAQPRIPWRRFFARGLDLAIAGLAIDALLSLAFRVDLTGFGALLDLLLSLLAWLLLIPFEAFCLSTFGTTLGKWILGIRVEHADGRRLTFNEAATRAGLVLYRGEGLLIPIYNIVRNWKSYKAVMDGVPTEWDADCNIILRDEKTRRTVAFIAAEIAVLVAYFPLTTYPMLPPNRGELTVDEFVENYNYIAERFDVDGLELQNDGSFTSAPLPEEDGIVVHVNIGGATSPARMTFTTDDAGNLVRVDILQEDMLIYHTVTGSHCRRAAWLSTLALTWADANPFSLLSSGSTVDGLLDSGYPELERSVGNCHFRFTEQTRRADDSILYSHYFTLTRTD